MARKEQELHLIFHLPESDEELLDIQRRITKIQAQAIIKYVDSLPIPLAQKQKLVDDIIADANAKAEQAKKKNTSPFPEGVTIIRKRSRSRELERW